MFGFILSRILQAIPVLLVVGFIAFAMFDYVGDPVEHPARPGPHRGAAARAGARSSASTNRSSSSTAISSGPRCTAISASATAWRSRSPA